MKPFALLIAFLSYYGFATALRETFDHVPLNQENNIRKIICGGNEYYRGYWASPLQRYQKAAARQNFGNKRPFYSLPNEFKAQGPYRLISFNDNFLSKTEPDSGDRLVLDKDLKITGAVTIVEFEGERHQAGHHTYRKCDVSIRG